MQELSSKAIELLKQLITIPSFSREEDNTATALENFFVQEGIPTQRKGNNVWAQNKFFDTSKPTLLLNSHHDTVKPNSQYTRNPFEASIAEEKLYGLGSNDAGGPLVSLIATFLHFYAKEHLKYNIVLAATAEEEISGTEGIESIWSLLPTIDFAIVGEPTLCEMAIAEKGLMVIDCVAHGKAGHAAREEGINAIYEAIEDINWFKSYQFPKVSATLGAVKMSVTIISAGQQHNVVPAECRFTVDVRLTDAYSMEEVLEIIQKHCKSEIKPRSIRLRPSGIALDHPLVMAAKKFNMNLYGSPTTSDQALIPTQSVKIGPGDSARSQIQQGIETYVRLLNEIIL
ncbi:MAG: M20/M25/M40 family metallo-hydrolase [Cytophagia bacterium]|nr:M20/M25/M40 family metallo-hydrolase [Cytophagia bacterium]